MALSYSNTVGPSASNALTSSIQNGPGQLSVAALANAKAKGLGNGIAIAPLTTPTTNLPTGVQPGGVISSSAYNQGVGLGAITPASSTSTANPNAAAINKAHTATLAALQGTGAPGGTNADGTPILTQDQLTQQNGGVANLPQSPTQNNSGSTGATNIAAPPTQFSGLVGNLVAGGQNAAGIAANYGQQIANVGKAGAAAQGGLLTTGTTPVAEGRAAVVAQTTAAQQSALAAGEQAALTGTGQQISASGTAAGLAQPSTTTPGQAVFEPLTSTYSSASSGGTGASAAPSGIDQNAWNQYIQDYSTGNFGAIPTSITNNTNLSGQLQQAVAGANPNFNYNAALGAGQATQSNAQTAGTAGVSTAAAGYQSAVTNYNTANAQYQTTNAQAQTLQQVMAQTGVNAAGSQYANTAVNQLQNQFGSANYTSFITALTEAQNTYATLLSSLGATTPTVNGQSALALLSPSATPAQINAAITQLQTAAYNKIAPMYSLIGTYQSNLGGNSSNNGTSNNSSSSIYSF